MDIKEETTQHKFLFIDMDGTIADYVGLINFYLSRDYPGIDIKYFWSNSNNPDYKKIKDSIDRADNFYFELQPISEDVVNTIKKLDNDYKVYFLSSPEISGKTCHSNKNEWIKLYFGIEWCKRLILTKDKTLVGVPHTLNFLIDDRIQEGINPHPLWKQIHYGKTLTSWDYEEVKQVLINTENNIKKSSSYVDLIRFI